MRYHYQSYKRNLVKSHKFVSRPGTRARKALFKELLTFLLYIGCVVAILFLFLIALYSLV